MQSDAERLAQAMRLSGQSDHYFVDLFDVAQSTVSRLRAKKITKVRKYIDILSVTEGFFDSTTDQLNTAMASLSDKAKDDQELADLLRALENFVHKIMH